jgi:hypothetical protein
VALLRAELNDTRAQRDAKGPDAPGHVIWLVFGFASGPLRSLATAGCVAMYRPPRRTWRGPLVLVPSPPTRWPGVGALLSQIDRCNRGSIGGTGRREPVDRWHPLALPQLSLSE